ncbi:ABCC2.2 family protein [Megaselia abdita]
MDDFCGSEFWNITEIWDSEILKIPPCFEQTVLIWTPCAFLWLFTIMEIFYMKNNLSRNIPWNYFNITKLVVNAAIIILTVVDLSLAASRRSDGVKINDVDFVTPIIKLVTFTLSAILVFYNRKYGIRSSGLLFLFWFALTVLSIPQCFTDVNSKNNRIESGEQDSWADYKYTSFMVYFSFVILSFLLTCFGDQEPLESKYPRTEKDCPENSASFLSRIFYHWFDKMAWNGYRKPLEVGDLWDLRAEDQSKEIMPVFAKHWNHTVKSNKVHPTAEPLIDQAFKDNYIFEDQSKKGQPFSRIQLENPKTSKAKKNSSVFPAVCKSIAGPFLLGSLLELIQILLTFASPLLLKATISFVESKYNIKQQEPLWKGISYAGLLFICAAVRTLVVSQSTQRMSTVGLRIRTALINAIYRKSLVISNGSRKESTVGEIVNLMAVDAEMFTQLTLYINMIWSAPLQIAVALYFLWGVLGPSVMAGFGSMLLMIPINAWMANMSRKFQVKQMLEKDGRVKLMNEILSGIKVLKLYAWELSFEDKVLGIRDKEIQTLKGQAHLTAGTFFFWTSIPFLVSLVSFATYVLVDDSNILDANTAFVSLSLFNILRAPLMILPMMITSVIQIQVSVNRINKFMNGEELDPNNVQHDKKHAKTPVIVENGDFSWGGGEVCIKKINIKADKGSLVAIVGTVGCGKTSVISAILGEMDKLNGSVNTVGTIAYVPQQAWLRNCTLRENILFGKPYDKKKYESIIHSCALKADIDMLSAGDQTEIGEKGINLSGGQKQRISLARAVYSDSDILLFDDPLSAVDSHVGKHIFDEVIGPNGILAGKTKILVTHGVVFLPNVDNIYVMKDGTISETGTYQDLLDSKGAFSEFLHQHGNEEVNNDEDSDTISQTFMRSDSVTSDKKSISSHGSLRKRKNSTESYHSLQEKPSDAGRLIEDEETETGSVKWEIYKHYIQSVGVFLTVASLFLTFAFQAFEIGANLWLTRWATDVNAATDNSVRDMYLGVYGGFGLAQAVSVYLGYLMIGLGCLRSAKILHNHLLRSVLRWPMELFDTTPLGRILNRFSKDVNILDNVLPELLMIFVSQLFAVIGTMVVISISSAWFLIVIIPIMVIYYFVQRFYVATTRQLTRLESVSRSPIYSHFGETITGCASIRAYKAQHSFVDESDNYVDRNQLCKYPNIIAGRWLAVRLEMVGNFIILFASLFAVLGNQENAAIVGLSITYALEVTQTMNWLVNMGSLIESNIVSIERIKEYIKVKQEAAWDIENTNPSKHWPEQGVVKFEDYKVRYREGLDLVLKGINFEVNGSEKIGIVGRTGAGKSSLTLALFRIIEAAGGKISIDGIDISILGLHGLRSRLTIIPQDPVLFSGSLRMNLDPFEMKTDEELWNILELAHLKTFVKSLTAGLNHEITEGGDNLSVGQRQLVCLARALLRKTKVLILDEATAAVDLETDDLIQKTIRTEFKECTILTIAHRLNTIMDSDRVIVMDKGEIIEFASPNDLLQNKNSTFYSMAKDANLV